MLLHGGLLLIFANCVLSAPQDSYAQSGSVSEFNKRFSLWPSVLNAARLMRVTREVENVGLGPNEGGVAESKPLVTAVQPTSQPSPAAKVEDTKQPIPENKTVLKQNITVSTQSPSTTTQASSNSTISTTTAAPVLSNSSKEANVTSTEMTKLNVSNTGEVKRGLIVFAGFALMAVAYFIFYRRKSKNSDTGNSHNTIDANQFRYGVLQSEDRRDKLELSRVPLTMDSDDDEDEEMEIFDLEQKKKSLSYVNLQMNDEDLVFAKEDSPQNVHRDNLLLDIEDGTSETLINWSSNGNNKSIL